LIARQPVLGALHLARVLIHQAQAVEVELRHNRRCENDDDTERAGAGRLMVDVP
jgi:hypothetical protein